MSDPRYVPKSFAQDPSDFGKSRSIDWIENPGADPQLARQLWAARVQHEAAFAIRKALRHKNMKSAIYAKASKTSYDRLLKVLRGDTIMRLEDLALAQRHLKLEISIEAPS